jgi:hypothetical protein
VKATTQRLASRLARKGENSILHAVVLALVLTGVFMIYTSTAWGPVAPLVIAVSCFVVVASLVIELILGCSALIRCVARARVSS